MNDKKDQVAWLAEELFKLWCKDGVANSKPEQIAFHAKRAFEVAEIFITTKEELQKEERENV